MPSIQQFFLRVENTGLVKSIEKLFAGKRPLKVERIDLKDYPQAAKVARVWSDTARQKQAAASSDGDKEKFGDSAWISGWIGSDLSSSNSSFHEAYVCKDGKGKEQGIVLITKETESIYVNLLVTNPNNIRSPLNEKEPDKVEGAGSALIERTETRALELGKKRVRLTALHSAKPFYLKKGFEESGGNMIKTLDKIAKEITPKIAAAAA